MTSSSTCRRILGVDPGLNTTGYGVIEVGCSGGLPSATDKIKLIEAGIIRSKSRDSIETRLHEIHEGLRKSLKRTDPMYLYWNNFSHIASVLELQY